ncbi:DNA topoisomerase IV subunit A [Mycoplasma capricolum]|uniref:DNA topoisomerase 4 subunit A n=2 Tax=Mycoplasma capricolum TaxID=2095 RepID=A0A9N7BJE1_MYCCC|nr:DNA topoisomerase IV subunit A [Mycoplasma capricolum]AJK51495.1 DNA topoisomerase IV subunit A [Mycoplasma capricolum subsp. capripneumoniae 87001]AOQ22159.1 DNA topoisomerase IV subunit A [Mycoplasma capricolum subsp. capripneumoniae M1601]QIN43102.1 DNA topoisomerase IV subunit A [Mycoplasma capricolum subsp. capripneumoniae]QIN43785.1 DNA topoisomerase IV subunit A [Mycoplasma capricolum subsp. capripneumoniae]QIN44472.1 DNA topoisomerase IV subunit A [Mycoplasma capricolum subsp. capri
MSDKSEIILYPLEELLGNRFSRYAKYIIQERALPDVRDGLKPVQRRILYAMNQLNLTFDKPYKKSARVVGEVIGKYHPHGDSSIYDAMVRMSQWWKVNIPLVDMQGNNGSIDGDSAAAMRYTEARLTKISNLLLEDLEKDTVIFSPNFDDSETEPTVLPSYFPNILVNGATGIAAGYATNMLPHNLSEIIDATINIIKNPNITIDQILRIVKGPDFPTGAIIQNKQGIREAFLTGKGKVIISSKWHQEKNNIVIDEIPYEVVKQDLVKKIGDVIDNNPNLGIKEIRDETDRKGLRIVIELNEKANLETVRKFLFKSTWLSVSYNYNNIIIVDKQPKQLGLIDIIKAYISHYKEVFIKRTEFNLNKANLRLEIVNGLIKALSILDEVIKVIRKSENKIDAINNLVKSFNFTTNQSTAIVDMRLYRLTSTDVNKLLLEKTELIDKIKKYQEILNNNLVLDNEIISRLEEVKKQFGIKRKSEVEDLVEDLDVDQKEVIIEKEINLWISKDGYIKVIDNNILNKNELNSFGKKPNDMWISQGVCSNLDHLILISDQANYYSIPLYKISTSKWKEQGVHINSVATTQPNETIINALVIKEFINSTQHLLLVTKNGLIKRTQISDLETKIFNKSFKIMKISDDDSLVYADLISSKTSYCCIVTKNGYAVRYNIEDIPIQSTISKGVKAANLKDDQIISALSLQTNKDIIIFTNKNNYKKIDQNLIPIYIRPKKGIRILVEKKKNKEEVIFSFAINKETILSILDQNDQITDINVDDLKYTNLEQNSLTTNIDEISYISIKQLIKSVAYDQPALSNSLIEQDNKKIETKNIKFNKPVSEHISISKDIKNKAINNANQVQGTDLSSYLDDISSLLSKFNSPKKDKKTKQLNFEDYFNDENNQNKDDK